MRSLVRVTLPVIVVSIVAPRHYRRTNFEFGVSMKSAAHGSFGGSTHLRTCGTIHPSLPAIQGVRERAFM